MTLETKKLVDDTLPIAGTVVAAWLVITKTKDWRIWVAVPIICFIVLYVLITQVTKTLVSSSPAVIAVGAGCDTFDPTAICAAIYSDVSCWICQRNGSAYDALIACSDCQVRSCYNYWNSNYYQKNSQTLVSAIAAQSTLLDAAFEAQKTALVDRFRTLGLT